MPSVADCQVAAHPKLAVHHTSEDDLRNLPSIATRVAVGKKGKQPFSLIVSLGPLQLGFKTSVCTQDWSAPRILECQHTPHNPSLVVRQEHSHKTNPTRRNGRARNKAEYHRSFPITYKNKFWKPLIS